MPIWGYIGVTIPFVMTPGVSTALVLRNSMAGGVRAGLTTAVGINAGSIVYGLLTAFGFALALKLVQEGAIRRPPHRTLQSESEVQTARIP